MTLNTNNISIYVHWPYCKSLCPYCDFNSHIAKSIDHDIWIESYKKEIDYFASNINGKKIISVFFGGGTPSLMDPKTIGGILNHLSKYADIENSEITLEANPTSSEAKKFKEFKSAGVNRLSIGVQSLIDLDLKILGREHNSKEAKKVIKDAANIFDNYSFDLIYARPNQNIADWKKELKEAISLSSKHISLYQLTIEKGTPFFKLYKDKKLNLPSNDKAAEFFDITHEILESNGYSRYEISNYSKPKFECKHNLTYWHYNDFIGIGPGAHSRINHSEIMMHHMPEKWLKEVLDKGNGIQKNKNLDLDTRIQEMIMMQLRARDGIEISKLEEYSNKSFSNIFDVQQIKRFTDENLINYNKKYLSLNSDGMNIYNYILSRIII